MACSFDLNKLMQSTYMLFPNGKIWDSVRDVNTNIHKLIKAFCASKNDAKVWLCGLLPEMFCSTQSLTNDRWLAEYGLPNACDARAETLCLLANGINPDLKLKDICEDALLRLGLQADFIDESVNGVLLTYSIIIDENSPVLQDCRYYAGSYHADKRICGDPVPTSWYASDESNLLNTKTTYAQDETTMIDEQCGFFAGDIGSNVADQLFASKSITQLIPNLSCVFEQIVPLGFKINFYDSNKSNPIFGV